MEPDTTDLRATTFLSIQRQMQSVPSVPLLTGRQVQSTPWPGDHTLSQPIAQTDGDREETARQAWMPPRSRTAYSTAKTFLQT